MLLKQKHEKPSTYGNDDLTTQLMRRLTQRKKESTMKLDQEQENDQQLSKKKGSSTQQVRALIRMGDGSSKPKGYGSN